ncbi:MAG TPA: thioredoxin fold domain-containing protein [Pyrinomonadaceae bacterium]|nr:thioredoxin fold domain-containing protein [Pyrinomonadaceae bacterium]
MKNILRLTLIVSVLLVFFSTSAYAKVPEGWLSSAANFEKALQRHRELNVPLVVYFYVDWCPYCKALENEYFPAAPMKEYLRDVVKIQINPELSRADYELGQRFGIEGYPAFFVISPNSFPVQLSPFRREGRSLTPAEFAQRCRDVTTPRALSGAQAPKPAEPTAPKKTPSLQLTVVEPVAPTFVSNAPLPTADAVLANYARLTSVASTAGRITSRVIKGRVNVPGLSVSGKFEFYAGSDGKTMTLVNIDPVGIVKQGFDGRAAWTASENGSKTSSLPENVVLAVADFYRDAKLSEVYPKTKLLGKVREGDREIYIVEAAPRNGAAEKLYFDVQSGLLVHRDFTRTSARGPIQSEIYFSDWRNVDGFRLPCSLTQMIGNLTLVITIDEIRHNVAIDEALFQRPIR